MKTGFSGGIAQRFLNSKLTPLLTAFSLVLGIGAVMGTPREEEPQIVVPMVDLFVGLPGADPREVENRVTIPLEKRMWEIPGVEYVYSASMPGVSMVTVRYFVGEDLELRAATSGDQAPVRRRMRVPHVERAVVGDQRHVGLLFFE